MDEPMAKICYDFPSSRDPSVRIKGAIEVREASRAAAVVATLNAEYGDGTHWVETLNETYAERMSGI